MRIGLSVMIAAVMVLNLSLIGCAKNASEKRAASPTMGERIKHDSITGKVTDLGPKHVSIRNAGGETMRVRVDDQTKMDPVAVGDQVKAFVTDDGYASTVQRVAP